MSLHAAFTVSRYYNWSTNPTTGAAAGVGFVPMTWNGASANMTWLTDFMGQIAANKLPGRFYREPCLSRR